MMLPLMHQISYWPTATTSWMKTPGFRELALMRLVAMIVTKQIGWC